MRVLPIAALLVLLLAPELADACTVCAANDDNGTQSAFRFSTAFLTVLPLALIGGVGWWLARRIRAHDAHHVPTPLSTSSSQ